MCIRQVESQWQSHMHQKMGVLIKCDFWGHGVMMVVLVVQDTGYHDKIQGHEDTTMTLSGGAKCS